MKARPARSATLEGFLARLYVDAEARRRFRTDPAACARNAGLGEDDVAAVSALDPADLELAARSFAAKRSRRDERGRARWSRWLARLSRAVSARA